MKWAWIQDDRIRDIAPGLPSEWYHPDVAVFYDTEVPDDAENGDGWVDGVLVKPEPYVPEVIDVVPTDVTPTE
jgi:hypothetical protein